MWLFWKPHNMIRRCDLVAAKPQLFHGTRSLVFSEELPVVSVFKILKNISITSLNSPNGESVHQKVQ